MALLQRLFASRPTSTPSTAATAPSDLTIATIAIFSLCLISYYPSMLIPSAHHDQYRYFILPHRSCADDGAELYLIVIGRPLGAVLECASFWIARTIPDVSWVRLLTVAILAVTGGWLAVILKRFGLSLAAGILLSASALLLPGSLSVVFQAVTNDYAAALLGVAAFAFLPRDPRSRSIGRLAAAYASVVLLLLAADLTYPATTALFFAPLLMMVLLRPTAEIGQLRPALLGAVAAFGLSSIVYFLLSKYYLASFATQFGFNGTGGYTFRLDSGVIWMNVQRLFADILVRMLNGWNIYPTAAITIGSSIVVVVGMIAAEFSFARSTGWHCLAVFEKWCVVIGLVFLSGLVGVLSPVLIFLNRVFLPFGVTIYLLFAFSLWALVRPPLGRLVPAWDSMLVTASFLTVIGVAVTAFNATTQALHDRDEFMFVKTQLAQHNLKDIKRVHVVRPPNSFTSGYNGLPKSGVDEFNVRILEYEPKAATIVNAALAELTGDRTMVRSGKIAVTSSVAGEPAPKPTGDLVIIDTGILAKANGAQY